MAEHSEVGERDAERGGKETSLRILESDGMSLDFAPLVLLMVRVKMKLF